MNLECWLLCAAAAAQACDHEAANGGFEKPMRFGQGFVKARAFLQFSFIYRVLAGDYAGGAAAGGTHGVDLIRDTRGATDGECGVTFG